MTDLYLRKVQLNIVPRSGGLKLISGLRIAFDIEKTNESNPNAAEIEIYNLSEGTRSLLEGKHTRVVLEAGYEGTVAAIFQGDVTKVVHKKEGPDLITRIEARDGDNKYRNSRIDRGFPPNIKTQEVFQKIADEMGLPVGSMIGIPNTNYANGLTLSGNIRDQLDDLCRKNDLEWSIQDETLQIIPAKKWTVDEMVLLSPATGLVGSPNKTKKGVEFVSLLQPKLRPGRRVQIEGKYLEGIFKVRRAVHKGDSQKGQFVTECEATA